MTKLSLLTFLALFANCAVADPVEATLALFKNECTDPLADGVKPDVSSFYAWKDQEITQLSDQLGLQPDGFQFWTPDETQDILIWSDANPVCQVIHIGYDTETVQKFWPVVVSDSQLRSNSKPYSQDSVGGFGSKKVSSNEFVQVSFQFRDFGRPGATLTMLTAVRVGQTPASCDLFPEECE